MCRHISVAWVGEVEGGGVVILLGCSLSSKSGSLGSCGSGKTTSGATAETGGSLVTAGLMGRGMLMVWLLWLMMWWMMWRMVKA